MHGFSIASVVTGSVSAVASLIAIVAFQDYKSGGAFSFNFSAVSTSLNPSSRIQQGRPRENKEGKQKKKDTNKSIEDVLYARAREEATRRARRKEQKKRRKKEEDTGYRLGF